MKVSPKRRLASLLWLIVSFFLLLIWGTVIYTNHREREELLQMEKDHLTHMSQIVSEQIGNMIRNQRVYLKNLDIWLTMHPDADPRFDHEFIRLVDNLRSNAPDIRLVSENGGLYYIPSSNRKPLALVADREYFTAQSDPEKRGFFIASPVKSRYTGLWEVPVSYPLTRPRAGISVIFSAMETEKLQRLYSIVKPEEGGTISLVRSDGILLARSPFEESYMGKVVFRENFYRTLQGGWTPKIIVSKSIFTDNKKRVIACLKMEDLPLVVIVSSDYGQLFAKWTRSHILRMLILLMVTVLVLIVAASFLKALKELSSADQKLVETNARLEESMETLRNDLAEKEVIIREANHRMKNQMTQLISIIQLSKLHPDEDVYEGLKARIQSFAVLYEHLTYRENQPVFLQLSEYVRELVARVLEVYEGERVILSEVECTEFPSEPKKNSVVGIILCELITNSIKYAFSGNGEHKIRVQIEPLEEGKIEIRYSDNGVGFDFNRLSEAEKSKHLGFILIRTLIRQYNGSLKYTNEGGSCFTIRI